MTQKEAEKKAIEMITHSYQMIQLAEKKDPDTYDVIYNVSKELSFINPKYTKKLQDFAIECKISLIDPQVVQLKKDLDFGNVESIMIEVFGEAIPEFFQKELGLDARQARQLWLEDDRFVCDYFGRP